MIILIVSTRSRSKTFAAPPELRKISKQSWWNYSIYKNDFNVTDFKGRNIKHHTSLSVTFSQERFFHIFTFVYQISFQKFKVIAKRNAAVTACQCDLWYAPTVRWYPYKMVFNKSSHLQLYLSQWHTNLSRESTWEIHDASNTF